MTAPGFSHLPLAVSCIAIGAAFYHLDLLIVSIMRQEKAGARIEARLIGTSRAGLGHYYARRLTGRWKNSRIHQYSIDSLVRAGWSNPELLLSRALIVEIVILGLVFLVSGSAIKSLGIATLTALAFMLWINARSQARLELFSRQLPGLVKSLAAGLAAGLSLRQALADCAEEAAYPAREELQAISEQISLGLPLDEALRELSRRLPVEEVNTLLLGLAIQRRSGGNLVELLRDIGKTIDERRRLQGNLRIATAQSRMSAKIIGAMPLLVTAGVAFVDPTYIAPLFSTPAGLIMAALAVIFELTGFLVLRKILDIDI
jgi:tight adherence protein B